jgi:biopolymer transport protein ExbB
MKTTRLATTVVLALLAACTRAAEPAAALDAASAAQAKLEQSVQTLNQLRERIAAEELPLAEELARLEDRLSAVRRDHDRVATLADTTNLETANLKTKVKARQDELTYTGNLLDEYARSFESKAHVSELQYCGEAVTAAKQATENTALSKLEKFLPQLALVDISLRRLADLSAGLRFQGQGVDLRGAVTAGQFALIGPVALFRSADGLTTGLALPQSGSLYPLIRPLGGLFDAGIAGIVEKGEGLLPLDPSRGGALKALIQKTSLIDIFRKGGPIMWPLLIASILALSAVIERVIFMLRERHRRRPQDLEDLLAAVARGDCQEAVDIGSRSRFFVVRALTSALKQREKSLANALLLAQASELQRFRRGISILDTVITLAPLLGLLGTVTGMMGSFSLIGGELSSPGAITGGIAEALIATAFGLGIAITSLIPFNILNTMHENARHELEAAATQVELLLRPPLSTIAAVAHVQHPAEALPNLGHGLGQPAAASGAAQP